MPETLSSGKRRLSLDGEWGLESFGDFTRRYAQLYYLLYSLDADVAPEPDTPEAERIQHAYVAYPWRGGYSTVNFYESLRHAVQKQHRLRVNAIRYESPGFIDLTAYAQVAAALAAMVTAVCGGLGAAHALYNAFYKGMKQRRLLRINVQRAELKLTREQLKFLEELQVELALAMMFPSLPQLQRRSPNQLASAKILMSAYRRCRDLAKLRADGRMKF